MKRLIFFFCILPQLLLAQLSNLSIQINDIAASASNKELTAQLTATADIQAGFLISLPAEIKMIPLAIEINQNNLALLNSDQVSSSENVVNWQIVDQGIVFLFASGQLLSGDQLRIRLALTLLGGMIRTGTSMEIRPVQTSFAGIDIADETISSANLPPTTSE